jgi:hypothetical protein
MLGQVEETETLVARWLAILNRAQDYEVAARQAIRHGMKGLVMDGASMAK